MVLLPCTPPVDNVTYNDQVKVGEDLGEEENMRTILAILALVLGASFSDVNAQPVGLEKPTELRVTGELLPAGGEEREDLVTVNIVVQDKPMLLRVGSVEELTRSEREQAVKWGVLFREMRFYGPEPLLEQLLKAQGTGAKFIIEGTLDTKRRQFLVSKVEEMGKARPAK